MTLQDARPNDIEVTEHALQRYGERLGRTSGKMRIARQVVKSRHTTPACRVRYGLRTKDDDAYEWRRFDDAFFLIRHKDNRPGAVLVTVLSVSEARRSVRAIKRSTNLLPKPKNRKRRR